tara:strand:+ start:83 stop:346 length:264 start_codon:yes stop_codon:yes gene_type:complete
MYRELKYILFIASLITFIFLISSYYFSNEHIKKSYRMKKTYDSRIDNYSANLNVLENDTDNIIDYFENTLSNDKKKYKFFELLKNDK